MQDLCYSKNKSFAGGWRAENQKGRRGCLPGVNLLKKSMKKEYFKRYVLFILGLYILSLGIALSTKANLGVSPVSSIPYVLSLALPLSLGQLTIVVQLIYLGCEVAILRKNFKPLDFLQILVVVVFGYFNDFSVMLLNGVHPQNYLVQWVFCVISMFIIAFGVNMEVRAGVLMLAADGLMATIARVLNKDFGKVKIICDCFQVGVAVVFSLLLMHGLRGVREGTVAAAIFVGIIIRFYNKRLAGFYEKIGLVPMQKTEEEPLSVGSEVQIITIAREVGSGGKEISRILGERMHLPVYDKDLLPQTAERSGLTTEALEEQERRRIYHFFRLLNDEIYEPMLENLRPEEDQVRKAQQEVVSEITGKESCIIVGRLGNYFLRDHPNCFKVFIHAQMDYRIGHFMQEEGLSYEAARREILRRCDERSRHYKYYTGSDYGYYRDYDLSINSADFGSEGTAALIQDAAERFFERNKARKEEISEPAPEK